MRRRKRLPSQLAADLGVSHATVGRWLYGMDIPSPKSCQKLADYSGIPRETVRRKVNDLERAGWIIRTEKGHLVASAKAAQDLAPATEAAMRYLLTVVNACKEAMSG